MSEPFDNSGDWPPAEASVCVVLNPRSGDSRHADSIRDRASRRGFAVRETRAAGDAVTLARTAAEGDAAVVVAAGGDGTVNEVVRGVAQADAFDRVTVGVLPVGTGDNFARNIGVPTVDEGFDALERGDRRRIDVGRANGRLFVNSCVGGLTADASDQTSAEMKNRFGVLAYVISTLRSAAAFEGLPLTVTVGDAGHRPSAGRARPSAC